jgi:hypothetical protein
MVRPSAGISNRRCLSFPEVSGCLDPHAPTEYRPGRNATASSMSTEMNYKHPSDSRVPPASRQRQRSQPPQPSSFKISPTHCSVVPPPTKFLSHTLSRCFQERLHLLSRTLPLTLRPHLQSRSVVASWATNVRFPTCTHTYMWFIHHRSPSLTTSAPPYEKKICIT